MDEEQTPTYQNYNELKMNKMKFQIISQAVKLTNKPKFTYANFNIFQLDNNRFNSQPQFINLKKQIQNFNEELNDWKINNKTIHNIQLTYHFYKNLFSRIKYVSNLVLNRNQARKSFQEIIKWCVENKPKIRNKKPEKEQAQIKPSTADRDTQAQIDQLITTNITKRQLKPYQMMARTSHKEFFPPSQRLLQYKRKDLLEGVKNTINNQRRASTVSNGPKTIQKYKGSIATTRPSFVQTFTSSFKKQQSTIQPVIIPFSLKDQGQLIKQQSKQQVIQQIDKQKRIQQQQLLQQNVIQPINEEDIIDKQQQLISQEQQQKISKLKKKYQQDPNAEQQMIAQQNAKDAKQSTLRRILKDKQNKVRQKLQQINIAQKITNWAQIKSKIVSDQHRKMERITLANKFKQIQYIPKTFQQRNSARKKTIPQFQILHRAKSSNNLPFQKQIQNYKITKALKTYSKYINHIQIKPIQPQNQQQRQQMKIMRSTSLTTFCRQGKRKNFSDFVTVKARQNYNQEALNQVLNIKSKLSKGLISATNQALMSAMGVTQYDKIQMPQLLQVHPPQKKLLNNPFFPKHLYETKSKKKK